MRGAICAIFIVILSKNYNGNALSHAWFPGKTPLVPSFALAKRTSQLTSKMSAFDPKRIAY
jgi:hypothetical protein